MASAFGMATASPSTRGQQRAQAACDECRRRKIRCDGQQPQCGVCQQSGRVCGVTERGARGPRKGYIKALKSRVVHLEATLASRFDAQHKQSCVIENSGDGTLLSPPERVPGPTTIEYGQPWLPEVTTSV
jgi:hypothetical protein